MRALGGRDGIEEDGAGVAAGALADHLGVGALSPDFQLFDGGGAEGIGGAEQDGTLLVLEAHSEFADGGGFAGAVDAHDQNYGGRLGNARYGAFAGLEDLQQVFADEVPQLGGVGELVAFHALANAFQNFAGGTDTDVGGDQGEFQFIQQI